VQWGLVPSWAKDPSIGARMINARSETAADKPSYRAAFRRRRCLIPADGFYEWAQRPRGPKQPVRFTVGDGEPFAFAGLWEQWASPDGALESCTILTTAANALVARVHDRMPVILPPEAYDRWLHTGETEARSLLELLRPIDPRRMTARPVSTTVNSPRNETPECIEPVGEPLGSQ
jgi:putative SOS response-associated peptidase YedK